MSELLDKILRRTKLNVAFAGAMLGSVSALSKLHPVMEGYSELIVHYYSGDRDSWIAHPCEAHEGTWRDFQKWFHGRPQSASYVMKLSAGSQAFLRRDVRGYEIKYGQRPKSLSQPQPRLPSEEK